MKFSTDYNLENINFVIEGTPIEIGKISGTVSTEASVQELATSTSFFKDLISEIKSTIKEASTTATTSTTVTAPASTPTSINVNQTAWDLESIWSVMTKTMPEGFKKGLGTLSYETPETKSTKIVFTFSNKSIDMDIYMPTINIFTYLYEDHAKINGINKNLLPEVAEYLPEGAIRDFVKNYIDKVIKVAK